MNRMRKTRLIMMKILKKTSNEKRAPHHTFAQIV
jgi:hypothetical protein